MALDDRSVLGCGRRIDDVWAAIDQPPSAHELSCEQCTAARASLQTLRAVTVRQRLLEDAAARDPDESLRPRARVRENILAVARAEVRRGRRLLISSTDSGLVLMSEQALLSLVRLAADSVPGVRTRRITVTPSRPGTEGAEDEPSTLVLHDVTCRVTVSWTVNIRRAVEDIRHRVVAVLRRHAAVDPMAVHIVVEDLYDA